MALPPRDDDPIVSRLVTPLHVFRERHLIKAGCLFPSLEDTLQARRQALVKVNPYIGMPLNSWESRGTAKWAHIRVPVAKRLSDSTPCLSPIEVHALSHRPKRKSMASLGLSQRGWSKGAADPKSKTSGRNVWDERIIEVLKSPNAENRQRYVQVLAALSRKKVPLDIMALTCALEFLEGSLDNAFTRLQSLGHSSEFSYHHFLGALTFLGLSCPVITGYDPYTVFKWFTGGEDRLSREAFLSPSQASASPSPRRSNFDSFSVVVRYAALRARRKVSQGKRGEDGLPEVPDEVEESEEEAEMRILFNSMKKNLVEDHVLKREFIFFWGDAMLDNATHWFALTQTQHDPSSSVGYDANMLTTWDEQHTTSAECGASILSVSTGGRYTAKNAGEASTWKATWKDYGLSRMATSASSMFVHKRHTANCRAYKSHSVSFIPGRRTVSFEAFMAIAPQICFDVCGLHFGLTERDL